MPAATKATKRKANPSARPAAAKRRDQRTSSGPQSAGADRRNEIIQIAARRFAVYGYETTTVREIADDANILSGSIYYHFETKDEILDEIIREALTFLREGTLKIAGADCDPELRITALIMLALEGLYIRKEAHSILHNDRDFLKREPRFRYVSVAKDEMYRAWRSVLVDGVEKGQFRPNLDISLAISTIVRALNNATEWFTKEDARFPGYPEVYTTGHVMDFNLDFMLRSIRHDSRVAEPIPKAAALDLLQRLTGFRVDDAET